MKNYDNLRMIWEIYVTADNAFWSKSSLLWLKKIFAAHRCDHWGMKLSINQASRNSKKKKTPRHNRELNPRILRSHLMKMRTLCNKENSHRALPLMVAHTYATRRESLNLACRCWNRIAEVLMREDSGLLIKKSGKCALSSRLFT